MVALSKNYDYRLNEPGIVLDFLILPTTTPNDIDEAEMRLREKEADGYILHNALFIQNKVDNIHFDGLFMFRPAQPDDAEVGQLVVKLIEPWDKFDQKEYDDSKFKKRSTVNGEVFHLYVIRG